MLLLQCWNLKTEIKSNNFPSTQNGEMLSLLLFKDPLFKSNRLIIQKVDSPIISASNIRSIFRHID